MLPSHDIERFGQRPKSGANVGRDRDGMLPCPGLARVRRDLGEGREEGGQVWATEMGLGGVGAGVFSVVFDWT
jgi:hypothetical protein